MKTVIALLVPDASVAFKILALNTEKRPTTSAKIDRRPSAWPAPLRRCPTRNSRSPPRLGSSSRRFLTLGKCYEERPLRAGFSPSCEGSTPSSTTRCHRPSRSASGGKKILKLDDAVSDAVEKLKAKGLTSPYSGPSWSRKSQLHALLKATSFDFDETLDKIIASAAKFNVDRVKQEDVAKSGGAPGGRRVERRQETTRTEQGT